MIRNVTRHPEDWNSYSYIATVFSGEDAAELETDDDAREAAERAGGPCFEGFSGQPGQWFQHRPSVRRSRTRVMVIAQAGYDV